MADNTVDLVALAEGLLEKAKARQLTQPQVEVLLALAVEGDDSGNGDPPKPKGDVKEAAAKIIAAKFGQAS